MSRVSIGIPTFNGAAYIEDALLCLQQQTCADFDVVISDNGSTDGTSDICARFAREDKRFVHARSDVTIPVARNYMRARDLTTAPYFLWLSDDDLLSPDYVERLADALDRSPGALLAVPPVRTQWYDGRYPAQFFAVPDLSSGDRVDRMCRLMQMCRSSWFYGLWRREAAVREWDYVIAHARHICAADCLTLLRVFLQDAVVTVPDVLFTQRLCRVPDYVPNSWQAYAVRRVYTSLAWEQVAAGHFSPEEIRRLTPFLKQNFDRHGMSWRYIVREGLKTIGWRRRAS